MPMPEALREAERRLRRFGLNRVHSFVSGLYLLRACLDGGLVSSCAANVAMHLALWGTREALLRRGGGA